MKQCQPRTQCPQVSSISLDPRRARAGGQQVINTMLLT